MKELISVRRMDGHGRLNLPREVRSFLGLEADDSVMFYVSDNGVYLKRFDGSIKVGELRKRELGMVQK